MNGPTGTPMKCISASSVKRSTNVVHIEDPTLELNRRTCSCRSILSDDSSPSLANSVPAPDQAITCWPLDPRAAGFEASSPGRDRDARRAFEFAVGVAVTREDRQVVRGLVRAGSATGRVRSPALRGFVPAAVWDRCERPFVRSPLMSGGVFASFGSKSPDQLTSCRQG